MVSSDKVGHAFCISSLHLPTSFTCKVYLEEREKREREDTYFWSDLNANLRRSRSAQNHHVIFVDKHFNTAAAAASLGSLLSAVQ